MAQSDLRRVERCRDLMDKAREAWKHAIREAAASGETYKDIARYAGVSFQRVAQIMKEKSDAPETDRPTQGGS